MAESVRREAEAVLKEVEDVTAVLLPEPKGELIVIDQAGPEEAADIERRMAELDMTNTQSIIEFGSRAQTDLQTISQEMLSGVRNQGRWACRRITPRDGWHNPRLLGQRTKSQPGTFLVGTLDRQSQANPRIHGKV